MRPFDPESPRFRLLPATIGLLTLLFFAKAYDVYHGTDLLISEASAETKPEGEAAKEAPPAEKADAEEPAKAEEKGEKAAEAKEGGEEKAAAAEGGKEGEGKEVEAGPVTTTKPTDILEPKKQYSQTEIDLLQSLAARRDQLDKREGDLAMKENLLDATEKRLDRKVAEIQTMEAGLKKLVAQYNEHQDAEIRSLVKIYENMKPVDAAAIFNEMEMPILILVVDKMSERKAAPVLAAMTPVKAKDLTVELAAERKARDDMLQQQKDAAGTPTASK